MFIFLSFQLSLKFLENLPTNNRLINECGDFSNDYLNSINNKFKPTHYLKNQFNNNFTHDNESNFVLYHRRTRGDGPLVYNTNQ